MQVAASSHSREKVPDITQTTAHRKAIRIATLYYYHAHALCHHLLHLLTTACKSQIPVKRFGHLTPLYKPIRIIDRYPFGQPCPLPLPAHGCTGVHSGAISSQSYSSPPKMFTIQRKCLQNQCLGGRYVWGQEEAWAPSLFRVAFRGVGAQGAFAPPL